MPCLHCQSRTRYPLHCWHKSRSTEATTTIRDGAEITVDATNGVVYEGYVEDLVKAKDSHAEGGVMTVAEAAPITGTKIYMNLGNPDMAEKYSVLPCDGIGLMREEFIWTTFIHEHPCTSSKSDIPNALSINLPKASVRCARLWRPAL